MKQNSYSLFTVTLHNLFGEENLFCHESEELREFLRGRRALISATRQFVVFVGQFLRLSQ